MVKKPTFWTEKRAAATKRSVTPEGALEEAFDYIEEQGIPELECTLGELLEQFPEERSVESGSEAAGTIKHAIKMIDAGWFSTGFLHELPPSPITRSSKLQLSVSSATDDLLKNWASSENRAVSDVAMFALETGLKALKNQGAIPEAALEATEIRSRQRLVHAEARAAVTDCLNETINIRF